MYEFKCVRELTRDHVLQVALYAYLLEFERIDPLRGNLTGFEDWDVGDEVELGDLELFGGMGRGEVGGDHEEVGGRGSSLACEQERGVHREERVDNEVVVLSSDDDEGEISLPGGAQSSRGAVGAVASSVVAAAAGPKTSCESRAPLEFSSSSDYLSEEDFEKLLAGMQQTGGCSTAPVDEAHGAKPKRKRHRAKPETELSQEPAVEPPRRQPNTKRRRRTADEDRAGGSDAAVEAPVPLAAAQPSLFPPSPPVRAIWAEDALPVLHLQHLHRRDGAGTGGVARPPPPARRISHREKIRQALLHFRRGVLGEGAGGGGALVGWGGRGVRLGQRR